MMTGAAFDALPYEEGRLAQLVNGRLLRFPDFTPEHQGVRMNFALSLAGYFREHSFGRAYPDVEFALNENSRVRPDVAVILHDNWRNLDEAKSPIPGAPDIAIEIISPLEHTAESLPKILAYLQHGVQEVWQVFPIDRTVLIYTSTSPLIIVSDEEYLKTPHLPGWQLLLSEALDS